MIDRDELARRLAGTFLEEAQEHLDAMNDGVLALERGEDPAGLLPALFRSAHSLKGAARSVGAEAIEAVCHGLEERFGRLRDGDDPLGPGAVAELLAACDAIDTGLRAFRGAHEAHVPPPSPRPAPRPPADDAAFVRVAAHKLDELLGQCGELLVARRRGDADRLARSARAVEDALHRLRMVSFGDACRPLARDLRDAARETGKQVELVIEGQDVQLDRASVDPLADALRHLVRNAVDHGVEPPATRRARGKSPTGKVTVRATVRSTLVEIVVADDGAGLDVDALVERATALGLDVPRDDGLRRRLAFHPGLSTRPRVTALSGRGVGLDAVRARVASLHGTVDLQTAQGLGTTVTLTVPLTLSRLVALLVSAGGQVHALPVASVRRLRRVGADELAVVEGRPVLRTGATPLPAASLAGLVGLDATSTRDEGGRVPMIEVTADGATVALAVDGLHDAREIVVLGFGPRLRGIPGVTGATLLDSGRVATILDPGHLVRAALADRTALRTAAPPPPPRAPQILVVEDSLTTRSLVCAILGAAGYDVRQAVDGAAAWRALQQEVPDVVVSDVEMPSMDGFALTSAIRRSPTLRDLPVILVTALGDDHQRQRGADAGADAYIVKGAFDHGELLQTIARLL